jgi:lipopolysaccharide export system permease protein
MRILDKYILKELLGPFIFGICAFSSIFIGTSTLFRIAEYITKYGASISSVVKLFIYNLPQIIVMTFPMSMLLASLLAFGRLSASNEIIAMKSGGTSFYRLSAPVFIAAFFVSTFATFFNEFVVPASNIAYNNVVRYEIKKDYSPRLQNNISIPEENGGVLERVTYAHKLDPNNNTMYVITIQEFANDQLVRVENAEKGIWDKDQWVIYNGIVHDLAPEKQTARTMTYEQHVVPIKKNPTTILSEQKKPEEMSIKELKQRIRTLQDQYVPTSEYEMEMHKRLSIPMASFVFALIGTPLGLQPHRSSSSIGLGISIIIIFIYYTIMTVTVALGQGGTIPAVWGAWLPNIIGIIAGAFLIRKASS